jgi:hypothetical protein
MSPLLRSKGQVFAACFCPKLCKVVPVARLIRMRRSVTGIREAGDFIATFACQRALEHIKNIFNLSSLELGLAREVPTSFLPLEPV